jgi:hypothetical protein
MMQPGQGRNGDNDTRPIANIAQNDAMILPYDASPDRMTFSERTACTVTDHEHSRKIQ